jgi:hypothetical protein
MSSVIRMDLSMSSLELRRIQMIPQCSKTIATVLEVNPEIVTASTDFSYVHMLCFMSFHTSL